MLLLNVRLVLSLELCRGSEPTRNTETLVSLGLRVRGHPGPNLFE